MKILLISASPRGEKSNTLLLAKEVLRGASSDGALSETVQLCGMKINFCRHCERCHKRILDCPVKDDVRPVLDKMLAADGIIIATPNYINQVPGSLKTLFDRSSHFIHCKRLSGKYIAGVVTSGSGDAKEVNDYVGYYANVCGALFSGGVSSRARVEKEALGGAYNLGVKLASDIREKKTYPEQAATIESSRKRFGAIMKARKDDWAEEYRFWLERDWL